MPERPDEVKEAVNLLKEFEKSESHTKRTRNFNDGIDLLNDYVEENPDSPHLVFIENIKTSYTRKLLEQLNNIKQIEIVDWVYYWALLLLKINSEVTKIVSEKPVLKEELENFLSIYREEILQYDRYYNQPAK